MLRWEKFCRVELDKGRDYLTDKGSTNGTTVKGKKITKRTKITDKDEIMVGKFNMVPGSVGILDVEKNSRTINTDGDMYTMYAPPKQVAKPKQ